MILILHSYSAEFTGQADKTKELYTHVANEIIPSMLKKGRELVSTIVGRVKFCNNKLPV